MDRHYFNQWESLLLQMYQLQVGEKDAKDPIH